MLAALVQPSSERFPDSPPINWFYPLGTAAFSVSIAVNAIVAILLACKIFMNHHDSQKNLKETVNPIRYILSVFNESGMLMLGCQIIWLVLFRLNEPAFFLVRGPIVMIYVSNQMSLIQCYR